MDADVDRVYADGHLFHGPEYQGLASFDRFARNGAHGRLCTGAAPGALLDNAGQLFGYWLACVVERDRWCCPPRSTASPSSARTRAGARADLHRLRRAHRGTGESVCDIELVNDDGKLWCRIDGWEDRRFATDDRLFRHASGPFPPRCGRAPARRLDAGARDMADTATCDVVHRRVPLPRRTCRLRRPKPERATPVPAGSGRCQGRGAPASLASGPRRDLPHRGRGDQRRPGSTAPPRRAADGLVDLDRPHRSDRVALVDTVPGIGIDVVAVEPRDAGFESISFAESELNRPHLDGIGTSPSRSPAPGLRRKPPQRQPEPASAVGPATGGCTPDGPNRFTVNGTDVETALVPARSR